MTNYLINLQLIEKLLQNPFEAIKTMTTLSVEEFTLHKAMVSLGDKAYKIIQFHTLKCLLIENTTVEPKIGIVETKELEIDQQFVCVLNPLHVEYLVAGNGRTDLLIAKVILDQLSLLLFPGNEKIMTEAKNSFKTSLEMIEKKKNDVKTLQKDLEEYKKQFTELINKDFPEILFQKILGFIRVIMTNEFFIQEHYKMIEEFYVSLLGYPIDKVRETALILLNCLYDGHLRQLIGQFFIEKILQVGDVLTLTNTFQHQTYKTILGSAKDLVMEITIPKYGMTMLNGEENPVKRMTMYMPLGMNIGTSEIPGEYDIVVGKIIDNKFIECQCSGGIIQSRIYVLPTKTKNTNVYSISEFGYKPELLTEETLESLGSNMVHIINIDAVTSRTLENNTFAQNIIERVKGFDLPDIDIMVDYPMEVSKKLNEASPYRHFLCKTNTNELAGDDTSAFMNYRSLALWEKSVEEILYLQDKYRVDAVKITSICDSLLPIAEMNTETSKSLTGCDVDVETIYANDALTQGYPNPFLRKLSRDIWAKNPEFIFFVEPPKEELKSSINSTVVPFIEDLTPLWSPHFKTIYQLIASNDELKQLDQLKEPFYPEKYPQGTTFAYQFQTMHPSVLHFISSLPIISELTPLNSYDKKHTELNKKRTLIRERTEHLTIFGKIKVIEMMYNGDYKSDKTIGIMREHSHSTKALLITINTVNYPNTVHFNLSQLKLKHEPTDDTILEIVDVISHKKELMTYAELKNEQLPINLGPFDIACYRFSLYRPHNNVKIESEHLQHSIKRCMSLMERGFDPKGNMIYEKLSQYLKENNKKELSKYINVLYQALNDHSDTETKEKLSDVIQELFFTINQIEGLRFRNEPIHGLESLKNLSFESSISGQICKMVMEKNKMGPIVFVTPELGRFSTIGGIGVLINELTKTLSELGGEIIVISPYYNMNKKGQQGYLKNEGIKQDGSVTVEVAHEPISCGLHYGRENDVDLYFLHNYNYFPMAYPPFTPEMHLRSAVLLGKASLQLMVDKKIHPSLIITNDWFTGMVPAYARHGFGDYFKACTFFHIVHNLEKGYIGDLYPDKDLSYIHELPGELVNNPGPTSLNMSMCALKCSDNWGTVSKSYMEDALKGSPLSYHLRQFKKPFACSNGISVVHRTQVLKKISPTLDHAECKKKLQEKYFNCVDETIPLFGFVGRICEQKGVFLLLDAICSIITETDGKCQFILGGMAPMDDPYAVACASRMRDMKQKYPHCFWADPTAFFTDGPLMNLGCDYTCMPSMFEPSGLVQQESFLGGTPVIAFQTGGLKDTVFEYNEQEKSGNGFVFQGFAVGDLVYAIQRSLKLFKDVEAYNILRQNAAKSVLDLTDVAIAWGAEFGRLKKKVYIFDL